MVAAGEYRNKKKKKKYISWNKQYNRRVFCFYFIVIIRQLDSSLISDAILSALAKKRDICEFGYFANMPAYLAVVYKLRDYDAF